MCVRSLSLSHGVARGGKVAFVVSDKKPLCLCDERAKMKCDETKERGLVVPI